MRVWWIVTDVSEKSDALFFREESSTMKKWQ
jgi:hypothetical protein